MESLLEFDPTNPELGIALNLSAEVIKAIKVVLALRRIGRTVAGGTGYFQHSRKEYLLSLLMATLNVVRLRHIEEERKLHAMLAAAMICDQLDRLAERKPVRQIRLVENVPLALQISAPESIHPTVNFKVTAQQKYLAERLNVGELILFIGSAAPFGSDWPTTEKLARQIMQEIDYPHSSENSAARLFAIFQNQIGTRKYLIDKLGGYFEQNQRPHFFNQIAAFAWSIIFTTNQHTYLEDSYKTKQKPYIPIVSEAQRVEPLQGTPIYKLHGCLSKTYRHEPATTLPITEIDYRNPDTELRLQQLLGKLIQELSEGKSLLMVYATKEELNRAIEWRQGLGDSDLIWAAGSDFSEDEQDLYRRYRLRILPDDPSNLLSVFSTLTQQS